MLYLLDANALIDANRDYYPLDRIPEFWDWLQHKAAAGEVKVPVEIFDEITEGNGELVEWIKRPEVKSELILDEDVSRVLVQRVVTTGYANDLTDDEVIELGYDPFLIAHALVNSDERRAITTEASKPSKQRANRRVPDVCHSLGVACENTFFLIRELDFSTSWRNV